MSATSLGIIELGDLCARQRALNLDLFRELGHWVTAADVEHQRWYAIACHRHAWHAELWAGRSPAIPPVDLDAATAAASRTRLPDVPDAAAYRSALDSTLADLDEIELRADADLDPATRRVITLVRRDLVELHDHSGR